MNSAITTLSYLVAGAILLLLATIYGTIQSVPPASEPERPVSVYPEQHRTSAPIICEWVSTLPEPPTDKTQRGVSAKSAQSLPSEALAQEGASQIIDYPSPACEVCVDHGMVLDYCDLVFGERRELYKQRVPPVIDSLLTEYHRQMHRWR